MVVGEPWTGLYTDVGMATFEPSDRIWSHRVAAALAYQGVRREGRDGLLAARQEYSGLGNGCCRQLASLA